MKAACRADRSDPPQRPGTARDPRVDTVRPMRGRTERRLSSERAGRVSLGRAPRGDPVAGEAPHIGEKGVKVLLESRLPADQLAPCSR